MTNQAASTIYLQTRGGVGIYGSYPAPGGGAFSVGAVQPSIGSGGSGGAGESAEFLMTVAQAAGQPWTVGAGGAGAPATPNLGAGGVGAAGRLRLEEYYTPLPAVLAQTLAFTASSAAVSSSTVSTTLN